MVVFSAAVITKNGKVLVARQYVPMTRIRTEGLFAAFPKLVSGDSQHTFVETDQVRYVYRPFDQLYILLVTNKQSNIMEDLDTLRLLASVVPEYCGGHTAEDVTENCFELLFAMDEVCGGGLKENVNLDQIKTFTEMDSHEEKLQKIILESKMNEARESARQKAKALDKQKAEMRKMQSSMKSMGGGGGGGRPNAMSGGRYGGGGDSSRYGGGEAYEEPQQQQQQQQQRERPQPKKAAATNRPKGMSLGGGKKKGDLVSQMFKEGNMSGPRAPTGLSAGGGAGGATAAAPAPTDKCFITILEKLYLSLEREGGVKKLDLQGELKIVVFDPDESRIVVKTSGALPSEYKCRLNPKVDQKEFNATGNLQLKDTNKPFPVGSDNAPVVLKWRMQTTDEAAIPFTINFWPNEEDGRSVVSVEYSLVKSDLTYTDVTISIPCPSSEPPEINNCDGDFYFDHRERCLTWTIAEISQDADTGSLEFSVPEVDADDFFPLQVNFNCERTYAGLEIEDVQLVDSGDSIDFETNVALRAEKFTID